jgi:hypothetical protein
MSKNMKIVLGAVLLTLGIICYARADDPKNSTPAYEGRAGVLEFLRDSVTKEGPKGSTLKASNTEIFEGALDGVADAVGSNQGRQQAVVALLMAHKATKELDQSFRTAAATTAVVTYEANITAAYGVESVTVPEWSGAVMTWVAAGNPEKAVEAAQHHANAEVRIDALKNPGWIDQLVFWWYRD